MRKTDRLFSPPLWLCMITAALTPMMPITAQGVATTGAPVLDLSNSARGTAMGWSGVADRSDPGNVFFNPANVTAVDGVFATGSYEKLVPALADDVWVGHLSLGGGHAIGGERPMRLGFGLRWSRLSYGESIATDPEGTPLGTYESREDVVGLTAGIASTVGKRVEWAFGAALNRLSLDYAPAEVVVGHPKPAEASVAMFDLGAVVSTVVDASDWRVRPALGLAAVNIGSDIEFDDRDQDDPLPMWFNFGVSVRVDAPNVTLGSTETPAATATINVDGNHGLNNQPLHGAFGFELALMQIISVRWGRRIDDRYYSGEQTWGIALGVPAGSFRARLEYASKDDQKTYGSGDVFGFRLVWIFDGRGRQGTAANEGGLQ